MKISDFFSNLPWRTDGNVSFLYLTPEQNRAIAIAVNNHDRLTEENKRMREALECIHEYASMIPLHLTDEKTHSNEHIMHFVKQIKSLSELGGE